MRRLRVLTWHVHGNYLWYLSRAGVEFLLPVDAARGPGYHGRGTSFPFGPNVVEVPAAGVRTAQFDAVLYQSRAHYEHRDELLSPAQLRLPRVYLEHDPPQLHPVEQRHWFDDPDGLLVHVTPFNATFWDSGRTPTRVVEHGVSVPESARCTGELPRGLTAVNHLGERGRRLGADLFPLLRDAGPVDLVGMNSEPLGGLGEVFPPELPHLMARYRFYLNAIRWTSLGLALLEAMTVGLPVVALATTEVAVAVRHGESGFLATDAAGLIGSMRELVADPGLARRMGEAARRTARERHGIERFARDWEATLADVAGRPAAERAVAAGGFAAAGGAA